MGDRLIGLMVLGASALLYAHTFTFRRPVFAGSLGPAFFPRVVLVALMVTGLALILFPAARSARLPSAAVVWGRARLPLVAFGTFGLYALLLPTLGFVVATFLYLVAVQYLLRPRPWRAMAVPAAGSLAAALGLQYLFERVLQVILPRGIWI